MDWAMSGGMLLVSTVMVATLAGIGALSAGLMVGLSERLVGFRVRFKDAFKAVFAAMVVTIFIRGIGLKINELVGYSVGSALVLIGVIYFLAWYLDRQVMRPDGSKLGLGHAYYLAGLHAVVMVVVTALAYMLIPLIQSGARP